MKRAVLVILALLVAAISGYFLFRDKPSQVTDHLTVRLKWLHQAQFAGFYAADQLGKYRDNHLDVELLPGGVDQPAIFQILTGSADVGVTGADQVLLARAQGHPIVAIAVIYRQTPFTLFSKATPGAVSLDAFKGRRVGVKFGGNEEVTYRAMLAAAGLSSNDFDEVGVKYDMASFYSGDVALWPGYRINESIAAQEKGVAVKQFNPEDYGVRMYADVIVTSESTLAKKHNELKRFLAATVAGWDACIADPSLAPRFVKAFNPDADSSHELAMMRASIPLLKPSPGPFGRMTREEWANIASILETNDKLPKGQDITRAFTNDLLP